MTEMMAAGDKGIPKSIMDKAEGVAVFPGLIKAGLGIGGQRGHGILSSRDAKSGTWQEVQRTSALPPGFTGKPWAADLHLSPDGRFLYASERTTSTIAAFKVDATSGKLTTIGSVDTEKQPRGFNIDPGSKYLAAVGELSDSMTVYGIDQGTGALTKLKSYPVGKKPNWVEIVDLK